MRLQLGIETDRLGPEKVVLLWEEADDLPIGGYLVVVPGGLALQWPAAAFQELVPNV